MNSMKSNLKYLAIIILLIIIILLLLFFSKIGKIQGNNMLVPTGNVDVFDIDVRCNCKDNGNGELPVFNPEEDKETFGTVFVDDVNGNYIYQQNLKIFSNSAYNFTEKIAPGVSNTYNFVVHNSSNLKLRYYVEMEEESEYFVNMKYRLKRNNKYVIGDDDTWVTADELKTEFSKIEISGSDKYSLDWIWAYDDNKDDLDTNIGENMESLYKLNIRFYFEETT